MIAHDADLPLDQKTYYQTLRKTGYRVAVVGKTDLHKKTRFIGRRGGPQSFINLALPTPARLRGR